MPKAKKPVHMTQFPTQYLALLFLFLKRSGFPFKQIGLYLGVTPQKISAICRHAKK